MDLPRRCKIGDYDRRCGECAHNIWQNEAVGDCRMFHRDVLHHLVLDCPVRKPKEPVSIL